MVRGVKEGGMCAMGGGEKGVRQSQQRKRMGGKGRKRVEHAKEEKEKKTIRCIPQRVVFVSSVRDLKGHICVIVWRQHLLHYCVEAMWHSVSCV